MPAHIYTNKRRSILIIPCALLYLIYSSAVENSKLTLLYTLLDLFSSQQPREVDSNASQ